MSDQNITLTKLDAAHRQLSTAIAMWFAGGDPVSIHTLAFAAHEVIHVIFRLNGGSDLLFDTSIVKDEHRRDFNLMIKQDSKFFKHAKKDHGMTHDFNPHTNFTFILASVIGLTRLNERLTDAESAFLVWNRIHNPSWFHRDVSENSVPVDNFADLASIGQREFFEAFLLLRRERREAGEGAPPS